MAVRLILPLLASGWLRTRDSAAVIPNPIKRGAKVVAERFTPAVEPSIVIDRGRDGVSINRNKATANTNSARQDTQPVTI